MEGEGWVTSHCLNKEGFPKLLYSTMARLGILDHPEYMGREYEEYDTERCEVTIYIRASKDFPDIKLWSVTTARYMRSQSVVRQVFSASAKEPPNMAYSDEDPRRL